ncbi:hypothetical protein SS50377_24770 [Spironucleus salmonicida]|uniref:Transmembrane protein n=1 Tax=Spironucleus salmonicida TaxID=348837 RepID=A0A9P8RX58_9EUKA|nr:hypothetical protein SS50377_24770 [Spironucleus salmonicida]
MNQANMSILIPQLEQLPDIIESTSTKMEYALQDFQETKEFQLFYKSQILFCMGLLIYISTVALKYSIKFDILMQFTVQMSLFAFIALIIISGIIITLDFISTYFHLRIDVKQIVKIILGIK